MPKPPLKVASDSILLALAESHDARGPIPLTDADFKRLKGAYPIYAALKKVIGDRFGQPMLDGAVIKIQVLPDDETIVPYTMPAFVDNLKLTAAQLRNNANSQEARPHSDVIENVGLVPVLQTVSRVNRAFGLDVSIVTDGDVHPITVLDPVDFFEPDRSDQLRKPGIFFIRGLIRDDARGHEFMVTDNELRVRLPAGDPKWTWEKVNSVLEEKTMLEATLIRESKAHCWTVDDSAILSVRPELPLLA